jgi:hypothetical protein
MWICDSCKKENCKNCESKWRCKCKCNKDRIGDTAKKILASGLGIGAIGGGIALTMVTGGIAIPVSGALVGKVIWIFLQINLLEVTYFLKLSLWLCIFFFYFWKIY